MKDHFLKLISDNQGLIFKVCNMYCNTKEDKEDLFQDIVLQLWRAYPSFKGNSKIATWMYRIALNNAITRVRKKTNAFAELEEEALQIAITDYNPDERMLEMYDAIKKLSEVERAITMLYLEDCSYREMSEILGITESNVGFKLNKIKAKLRTLIKVA